MKILIATDWYKPVVNGVVTSVLNLENTLRAQGHEVRILTVSPNVHNHKEPNVYYMRSVSVNKIYPKARIIYSYAKKYIKEIIEWGPEIVHTQCEFSSYTMARIIAGRLNVPMVHTYHTVYEDYTHYFAPTQRVGKGIATVWSRHVANRVHCMIVPTEKVRRLLRGYHITKPIEVIPSGIDLARFEKRYSQEEIEAEKEKLGIPTDKLLCVSVGRLAKEKNESELLRFFRELAPKDCMFLVAGDGPYRKELEKEAHEMGLDGRVIFSGMIEPARVPLYYQMGDVFLCASKSETQGITYIEAMASGVPVLCRRDDCLQDVIDDGINGMCYDTYAQFAEAFAKLRRDRTFANMLSENAMKKADEYGLETFAARVMGAYRLAISEMQKQQQGGGY